MKKIAATALALCLSTPLYAQPKWLPLVSITSGEEWVATPGYIEFLRTKEGATIAVKVLKVFNQRNLGISPYQWYVFPDDCLKKMGEVWVGIFQPVTNYSGNFVFGSGNFDSFAAEVICSACLK